MLKSSRSRCQQLALGLIVVVELLPNCLQKWKLDPQVKFYFFHKFSAFFSRNSTFSADCPHFFRKIVLFPQVLSHFSTRFYFFRIFQQFFCTFSDFHLLLHFPQNSNNFAELQYPNSSIALLSADSLDLQIFCCAAATHHSNSSQSCNHKWVL